MLVLYERWRAGITATPDLLFKEYQYLVERVRPCMCMQVTPATSRTLYWGPFGSNIATPYPF